MYEGFLNVNLVLF